MITKIKDILFRVKALQSIEIQSLADGSHIFSYVHLAYQKGIVEIVGSQSGIDQFEGVISKCKKEIPIMMVFSGKGIIHKKISKSNFDDLGLAIGSIVPNGNANDFVFDHFETETDWHIGISRKSKIESFVNEFYVKGLDLISLSLDMMPLIRLIDMLNLSISTFTHHQAELVFENQKYNKIQPSDQEDIVLEIGSEKISPNILLPYAHAFAAFVDYKQVFSANIDKVVMFQKEFGQKQIYKKALLSGLSFLLLILLINTFIFTNNFKENESLKQRLSILKEKSKNFKNEELGLLEKEKYLSENGWLNTSRYSFISDRLAASVPSSIDLLQVNFNPLKTDPSISNKKSIFTTGILTIKGKCFKSTELSNWIQILKNLNWVNNVQMKDYNFDHSNASATFNIEILYRID